MAPCTSRELHQCSITVLSSGLGSQEFWGRIYGAYFTESAVDIPHCDCDGPLTTYCLSKGSILPEGPSGHGTFIILLIPQEKTGMFYRRPKGSPVLGGVRFLFSLPAKMFPPSNRSALHFLRQTSKLEQTPAVKQLCFGKKNSYDKMTLNSKALIATSRMTLICVKGIY